MSTLWSLSRLTHAARNSLSVRIVSIIHRIWRVAFLSSAAVQTSSDHIDCFAFSSRTNCRRSVPELVIHIDPFGLSIIYFRSTGRINDVRRLNQYFTPNLHLENDKSRSASPPLCLRVVRRPIVLLGYFSRVLQGLLEEPCSLDSRTRGTSASRPASSRHIHRPQRYRRVKIQQEVQ